MSTSQNDFDDLKIVISRVDDICNFLNNMKKSSRATKERLNILESNYKRLEQNQDSTSNQIKKRLENVETSVMENQDKMKIIEVCSEEVNIKWAKEKEIERTDIQ